MFNLFKPRPRYWVTPGGKYYELYANLAAEPHLLIAGDTGSGKSVTMEGIIVTVLSMNSPAKARFVLVDTKKVALYRFSRLPHVVQYVDEVADALSALETVSVRMDERFREMRRQGVTDYQGADEYIVIDELADLVLSPLKKKIIPILQRISMLGRAAKVHLIIGTQNVTREVVSSPIKSNLDVRICLRTACAQDSRNVCGVSGAEQFPSPIKTGKALALIRNGADIEKWNMPRYSAQ